jgi:hypothetical protein
MTPRPPETILAEWRAAEAAIDGDEPDPELVERIERLRAEHAAALAARDDEARELGRTPGLLPDEA